jgi:hypothetical protein
MLIIICCYVLSGRLCSLKNKFKGRHYHLYEFKKRVRASSFMCIGYGLNYIFRSLSLRKRRILEGYRRLIKRAPVKNLEPHIKKQSSKKYQQREENCRRSAYVKIKHYSKCWWHRLWIQLR